MSEQRVFVLVSEAVRERALTALRELKIGMMVVFKHKDRTLEQNAKFHKQCRLLAESEMTWVGKRRSVEDWKVLLVSGFVIASARSNGLPEPEYQTLEGIEGEVVGLLRESTSGMSVQRMSELIDYVDSFLASIGIEVE
jgi:hypothetical protein